jgi:hypothetical protein
MERQSTHQILMISPESFRKNEQTAINNYYQTSVVVSNADAFAKKEFDALANLLISHGVEVMIWNDRRNVDTPDRIFPNNWISFHEDVAVLYPMNAENRRAERNPDLINHISKNFSKHYQSISFVEYEDKSQFLEGTGSVVLDRIQKIAFAAISPRTDLDLFLNWCKKMNYQGIPFHAFQSIHEMRKPIYHTNVMMSIGSKFALICADCIDDVNEKTLVIETLRASGREVMIISESQVNSFCGNILEVTSSTKETFIVMSSTAYHGFTSSQLIQLETWGKILHSPLSTIEVLGGGSARCMLAEVF